MTKTVRCRDGCGNTTNDVNAEAWTSLQITGRYRCPKCARELALVNSTDVNYQRTINELATLKDKS